MRHLFSKIIILILCLSITSCATKTWVPVESDRGIASEKKSDKVGDDPSILKTDWGYVKISYNNVSQKNGISFKVEVVNQTKKTMIYDRSFIKLIDEKGKEHFDIQKSWVKENKTAKKDESSSWRFIAPVYVVDRENIIVEMREIPSQGTFHDELFFESKVAMENNELMFVFGPEIIRNEQLNSLKFVATYP